jgi:NADH-quinone oxidoreductase subunit L
LITIYIFGVEFNVLDLITFCFIIGAIGKSAQIFLECWLASAMEGPTPVSSLLHASTLVLAGVFVKLRLSTLIENSFIGMSFLVILGSITSFFAATSVYL